MSNNKKGTSWIGAVVAAVLMAPALLMLLVPSASAAASTRAPHVSGVSITGSAGDYTVTVNGSGFGQLGVALPFTGDSGSLRIGDMSQLGFGEWGYSGDANALSYDTWTSHQVVISDLGAHPGDALTLALWNPQTDAAAAWGGDASPLNGAPTITSVLSSGSGASTHLVIKGTGFGSAPVGLPFTGDINNFILNDWRGHCGGGSSQFEAGGARWGAGNSDAVTLDYTKWSPTKIVVNGFSGSYGSGCAVAEKGDPVTVAIWNSQDTAKTGLQVAAATLVK